ncbi:FAD-binding domain-containing protein [Hanstruepera neustonica]|uniref:FAD-binding domain-containing protein n=1 Tax=Hanstruepera neustonica TaxID=1445657 RepID=UPI001FAEC5F8|nr:FAD-binding domain-containing protein [Hanstruepera neustonica]
MSYAATRNYQNGKLTYLSPYISRGVISTKQIFHNLKSNGYTWEQAEKLIQELAWRDYWQLVWKNKGDDIFQDLKQPQNPVSNHGIPQAIVDAKTDIFVIDDAIQSLYRDGYMHNHMRMYVASICCNIVQSHWSHPSQWLYYNLLDGDLASNTLSWQWVAGSNANKKYYANQDNINKYFDSHQKDTFLDVSYEEIDTLDIPSILRETMNLNLTTSLPKIETLEIHDTKTLIYNYYNLDPFWYQDEDVQRILLLEPQFFEKYPVNDLCVDFILNLSKNIPNLKIVVMPFADLLDFVKPEHIYFKEHPTNTHYTGHQEPRDWMTTLSDYYPSFFAYWKRAKKQLQAAWSN